MRGITRKIASLVMVMNVKGNVGSQLNASVPISITSMTLCLVLWWYEIIIDDKTFAILDIKAEQILYICNVI